ncbi:MAG: protein kinase [Flavobacteriales bacterium]|nr:protein kinase [Flavobacteriales bacterium]
MIKSIANITDISVIDQNGINDILSISKIDFDDNPLGSGAFGSVHKVNSIDGKTQNDFVLKVFTDEDSKQHAYDVIKLLHVKLKKRQQQTKVPTYHDLSELLGLPFMVFKGYDSISEKHCVAFLMYNLYQLGYEDYGSDTANLSEYKNLSIPDKLYLAYQLTKTVDFLHTIEFIHADISENSLWFNANRIQLSIIDFDSGYHFDSQDKPTTLGKIGHAIGRKFRNLIGRKKDSSQLTVLDRLFEEYWQIANYVFEIIFGVIPYFFLNDADDSTKLIYLKDNEWPNIDYASPLFNAANQQQHQTVISFIEQLENAGAKNLIDAFKRVFNKGYKNENQRLTSTEWKNLLIELNESLDNTPLIKSFTSDKTTIDKKNESVNFSFNTQKYNALYLDGELVPLQTTDPISISLDDSKEVTLKVKNDFGEVEGTIRIQANKVEPEILSFEASKLVRDSLSPINLTWRVSNVKSIKITNVNQTFEGNGNIDVEPTTTTKYCLTALGFFDQKVTKELIIDVVSPKINFFTWEVNLEHGIDNVDLKWETEDTQNVEITPNVKETMSNGLAHVPISMETTFKLIAKGLFNSVEKEITAHPFPVPVVKQIFAEAPKIELKVNIETKDLAIPSKLLKINNIKFNNSVQFNNLDLNSTELKSSLEFPDFENENYLIEKYSKEKIKFSDIYQNVLEKINNRLKK